MCYTLKLNPRLTLWTYLTFLVFLLFTRNAFPQKTEKYFEKAGHYYQLEKYEKAIHYYTKIIQTEFDNVQAYLQCARCYEKIEEYAKADELYAQIISKSEYLEPEIFLEYGDLLMKLGRNDDARSYYMSYNNLMENHDLRVLRNIKSIEDIEKYYLDTSFISLQLLSFSSDEEDYNPRVYDNNLYFESNREFAGSDPLLRTVYVRSLSDNPDSKSKKVMIFGNNKEVLKGFAIANSTGEIFKSVSENTNADKRYKLKRAFIENAGTRFSKEEIVSFDDFEENIFFPAVNHTGQILVFASDAEEGIGGLDLYISYRGSYGYNRPALIDGFINTKGNECYPFLVNDTILFFASDGHGGLGGYDLYYVNLNKPSSIPVNLGSPINSQYDEFGLSLSEDHTIGFVISDRTKTQSRADIYQFELNMVRAIGEVTDQKTGDNLKNVAVSYSAPGDEKSEMILADNGRFSLIGMPGEEYNLIVSSEGYEMEEFYVSTASAPSVGLYEVNIGRFPIVKVEPDSMPAPEKEIEPVIEETILLEKTVEEQPAPVSGTLFRLQIAASRVPLDEGALKKIYKGSREIFMFEEDNWYKYAIGDFRSFFEANAVRRQCNVKGAFIAAYSDDSKLELRSAIREFHSKPAELRSESATTPEKREIIKKTTLFFPFDNYKPTAMELKKIDDLLNILKNHNDYLIEVDGYTDIQGSKDYNYGLAAERARYVKDYLISNGIDRTRITDLGYGEKHLRKVCYQDCTPAIHRENRRAEITVYTRN